MRTLRGLLDAHGDEILDIATAWVRREAEADLSDRPYAETRALIAQTVVAYAAQIFAGDVGPRDAFIEAVTSSRSNLKFRVSTLLRGFMGFREGVGQVLARTGAPAELALAILQRVDAAYADTSFRTADIYVAKVNRVLAATREELIRKDKLAALGGLVAGVAHEIATPLGIAVNAASLAADRLHDVERSFAAGTLRRQDLTHGLAQAQEAARLTLGNLRRAADLLTNFKQIAVDQASEARREVSLGPYLRELVASLAPLLRRTPHRVAVDERSEVVVVASVGALSQIVTNLVQNALMHAFPAAERPGQITIEVDRDGHDALVVCRDDGAGMTETVLRRVFEPFFTTLRGRGGSGLGMHIVHNLVTDVLRGSVGVTSAPSAGTRVELRFPTRPQGDP